MEKSFWLSRFFRSAFNKIIVEIEVYSYLEVFMVQNPRRSLWANIFLILNFWQSNDIEFELGTYIKSQYVKRHLMTKAFFKPSKLLTRQKREEEFCHS